MDNEKIIKFDYINDLEARIHAIERLEALGLLSKNAEAIVEIWDKEKENK